MAAPDLIEEPVIELELIGSSRGEVSGALVGRAVEIHIAEDRADRLTWLLSHPSLTEGVISQLVDSNPDILNELGHQSGPRKLLELLAEKYRYPEAALTIAKHLYTSPNAAEEEFQAFLASHAENEWMLNSLAHLTASTAKKEEELIAVLQNQPAAYDYFIGVQRSRQWQKRAMEATSLETMRELLETGDPAALRGLARNPHTPEPLLRELARTEGIKFAREIRASANESLRKFSRKI